MGPAARRLAVIGMIVSLTIPALAVSPGLRAEGALGLYEAWAPTAFESGLAQKARAGAHPFAPGAEGALEALARVAADTPGLASARALLALPDDGPIAVEVARAQWRPGTEVALPPMREAATLEDALRALLVASGASADAAPIIPDSVSASTRDALRRITLAYLLLHDANALAGADASLRANARDAAFALVLDAREGLQREASAPMEVCDVFAFDLEGVPSTYDCEVRLLVDVGGDDLYRNNAGGNVSNSHPGLLLDEEGDDVYAGHDTQRLSFAGGAETGIGMLLDLAGDDTYDARFEARGAATGGATSFGAALLYDAEGNDTYAASVAPAWFPLGDFFAAHGAAASVGIGLLVDLTGDDTYRTLLERGGSGSSSGAAVDRGSSGLQYEARGNDSRSFLAPNLTYYAANGASVEGVGVLIDRAGDDEYEALASSLATAAGNGAATGGLGALFDLAGSDTFRGAAPAPGATNGGAGRARVNREPVSVGILYAGGGDTRYFTNGTGAGAAVGASVGMLVDEGGHNLYESGRYCGRFSVQEAFLPSARSHVSAVYDGARAYVFGGETSTLVALPLDEIVAFDPLTNRTQVMGARLPVPLADTAAVWTGSRALLFGGRGEDFSDRILSYDPANDTLTTLPTTLPTPRSRMTAVWTGERAILAGGLDADGVVDDILLFDPANGTLTVSAASLPLLSPSTRPGIQGAAGVWSGGLVHLIGGVGEETNEGGAAQSLRSWLFDPTNETLIQGPDIRSFDGYASSTVLHLGRVYIMGGAFDLTGSHSQIVSYDPATGTSQFENFWGEVPVGSPWGAAVSDGTNIYQFSRRTEAGDPASILAYDPFDALCTPAYSQGAGAHVGVGILLDRGDEATFRVGTAITGQGAGVQGVGILRREPQGGARLSLYEAAAGSTPMAIAGAGIGLRLDEGFFELLGAQLPDFTCGDAMEYAGVALTLLDSPAGQVSICGRDESTRRPILDPQTGKPMTAVAKPPVRCADLPTAPDCRDAFDDDPTLLRAHNATLGILGHEEVTLTTEGGLALLRGTIRGASVSSVFLKANQMGADDACKDWC